MEQLGREFRIFLNWFKLVQEFRNLQMEAMSTPPGPGRGWYGRESPPGLYDSFT